MAEVAIASHSGVDIDLTILQEANDQRLDRTMFGEAASRIIVAATESQVAAVLSAAAQAGVQAFVLGNVTGTDLVVRGVTSVTFDTAHEAWRNGLRG